MKKSLLDEDESPSHDLTTIYLDEEASEDTRLSPNKYVNHEERSAFHSLPCQTVKTSRGNYLIRIIIYEVIILEIITMLV